MKKIRKPKFPGELLMEMNKEKKMSPKRKLVHEKAEPKGKESKEKLIKGKRKSAAV